MKLLSKLFPKLKDEVSDDNSSDIDQLQLATCILLIEVSKSDDDFDTQEQEKIKDLVKKKFNIPQDKIDSIFIYCNKEHDTMTSLYDWTEVINKECNYEQKCMIIGFMWDIAFTDSKIDKYEDLQYAKLLISFTSSTRISLLLRMIELLDSKNR